MTYRLDSDLPDPSGRIVLTGDNEGEHHRQIGFRHEKNIAKFETHDKGKKISDCIKQDFFTYNRFPD